MNDQLTYHVECYSGHTYAERPKAFYWEEKWVEVEEVEAEWIVPEGKHFQARATDGLRFDLIYYKDEDRWSINIL